MHHGRYFSPVLDPNTRRVSGGQGGSKFYESFFLDVFEFPMQFRSFLTTQRPCFFKIFQKFFEHF